MTDIRPESAPTPETGVPAPDPGDTKEAPRRASRLRRNPLVRIAAVVAGLALGWGAFQVAQNLWAARNDNTPISASSHAPSGALTVSGHGVTLAFPSGWVNVPTTPNELARFMRARAAKYPHIRAALKNQLANPQALHSMAMLVFRVNGSGAVTGSTDVVVVADTTPPRQLLPQLNGAVAQFGGTHEHEALTTFGKYPGVLVTYRLPTQAGQPAEYGVQAYVHGPASTPIITMTTTGVGATATLRQIADTIKFS
jgi:hypothetical protein